MELKTYIKHNITTKKLIKEIIDSNSVQNFDHIVYNDSILIIYGDLIINENLLDDVINNHIIDNLIIEVQLYNKRSIDGKNAFYELMSELRINSILNNYPRDINKYIERKLKNVRDEIILGQWISALEYLQEITIEGYFTKELYDRIYLKITEYIENNY